MLPIALRPRPRALAASLALAFTAAAHAAPTVVPTPASGASAAAIQAAPLPQAATLPRPSLPSPAQIDRILAEAPMLGEAGALRQAATHGAQVLRLGTNEFGGQAQVQQRRIDTAPDAGNYAEWQLLVNRQIRLPSQARADARMADAMIASAQAGADVARRTLLSDVLGAWFAAQRAQAEATLAADDLALIGQQLRAVQRRQALGDASVLEVEQMQAEEARARSMLVMAQGNAASTRAALIARYPALAADAALAGDTTAPLALPDLPAQALLAQLEQHDVALARSRAALRQAQAAAAQATAARSPRPTVGVYLGSERGGNERIVGVQFAMPFGGPARVEQERAALAEADAARWRLRDAETRARAEFERLIATAQAQAAGAGAMEAAAATQSQAGARMLRAYQLGEAPLSGWLLARRTALEALRQWLQLRFDAAQSAALVRLQAGLLFAAPAASDGANQ